MKKGSSFLLGNFFNNLHQKVVCYMFWSKKLELAGKSRYTNSTPVLMLFDVNHNLLVIVID
jgi:hypothetical protein